MIFADSDADYAGSKYVIRGILFDGTSSFRTGSRWAPEALRIASHNYERYDFEYDRELSPPLVHDMGDEEFGSVAEMMVDLEATTSRLLKDEKVPITLGGEHSISFPCVKALANDRKIVAVIVDAHLDFRESYLGNEFGHACVARNIVRIGVPLLQIGIRSGSREEYKHALESSVIYTMDQIRRVGINEILVDILPLVKKRAIYLSVDMDAIDPAYAPGVGNPEPYGLTPLEVRTVIRGLSPYVCGLDLVEITPEYDMGMSALVGAKLVRDFLFAHSSKSLD